MQLACDVQIPAIFGGLESEAVYIDVERTLIIDRLRDLVKSTVEHCHQIAGSGDEGISCPICHTPPYENIDKAFLTLNEQITTKVVCFSRLLKCLRSLYGKRCLFWVHAVCFYT